ncbi:hypothetical protein DSCO28_36260 [Desulfosarcina ovata subsp. sediminis]|uniref:Uncharacterized protein n=2 Tax=Desulfosarcina ovata TaxID=83564 RepID=A0A5K7ZS75_9BACT|nr:hypothetical protein DSCO28_36260 [Desulfosarcina ovata subsp. sediminis]
MIRYSHDPLSGLFSRLISALEHGGQLTRAILDYIGATLFDPSPCRLAAFLADDDDSERDSLLDLIFYPDEAIQIQLEPLLAVSPVTPEDEAALKRRMLERKIQATIRLPDKSPLTHLILPAFIKSQYIERLKLSWQLEDQVAAAIASGVSPARVPMVRVRLRNNGLRVQNRGRQFLCRFFERMPDDEADYLACLDLVLPLVQRAYADGYDQLVNHKRELFRTLQQARRFETLMRQSNMETLMLQGVRAPHADSGQLLEQMRLIDRICLGVFGRTETLQLPMEEPPREIADLDDTGAVIRSLWR